MIWKSFIEINKVIYTNIKPSDKVDWDLIRQTKRAMISVGLNIAEHVEEAYSKPLSFINDWPKVTADITQRKRINS